MMDINFQNSLRGVTKLEACCAQCKIVTLDTKTKNCSENRQHGRPVQNSLHKELIVRAKTQNSVYNLHIFLRFELFVWPSLKNYTSLTKMMTR